MDPHQQNRGSARWCHGHHAPPESVLEDPLDRGVLDGLRELQENGEPDLLGDLAQVFLDDATTRLAALHEAVRDGDATRVERLAHILKGSSGSMGARLMLAVATELQDVGGSGDPEGRAPVLLERLDVEFERARAALLDELREG